ncbi:MAG: hypothetical protein WA624_22775 [Methylocella sp.]
MTFGAYEIVTGQQAPERFFEVDRRSVSKVAVAESKRQSRSLETRIKRRL